MQSHLAACPSAAHRAVLGLVSVALGRPVPEGLTEDLDVSASEDLAQIANAHFVHTMLADAFRLAPDLCSAVPKDFRLYLTEIQAANGRRNAEIESQLRALGAIVCDSNRKAVVLKGAADRLAPLYAAPGVRLLSDVDVLLGSEDVSELRAALLAAGAREEMASDISRKGHHHMPPLHLEGWLAPVELHWRVGQGTADRVLPAEDVLADASHDRAFGLWVPAPEHRLVHAVIHAQLGHPDRMVLPQISLRDLTDFTLLSDRLTDDALDLARERFERTGTTKAFDGFRALSRRVFDTVVEPNTWASQALSGFGAPDKIRRRSDLTWVKHYATGFLRDPARRRQYLKKLGSWRDLRRIWAFHRDRRRRLR